MIYITDLETNGLTMSDVDITQVAYLKLNEDLEIESEFNEYFYSNNLKDSAEITGLDYNKLAKLSNGKSLDTSKLKSILNELRHGVIVGQNITFDVMVLDAISLRSGIGVVPKYPLDIINQYSPKGTLMNLGWISKNYLTEEGQKILDERFKDGESYHDALYDVYTVYAIIKNDPAFRKRLNNFLKTLPRGE